MHAQPWNIHAAASKHNAQPWNIHAQPWNMDAAASKHNAQPWNIHAQPWNIHAAASEYHAQPWNIYAAECAACCGSAVAPLKPSKQAYKSVGNCRYPARSSAIMQLRRQSGAATLLPNKP
jgi:hypothetical protein